MYWAHSSSNIQFIHSRICITLPLWISSSFTRLSSICIITHYRVEVVPAFIRGNPLKLAWYFIDHPSITSLFSRITRCSGSAFDFSAPSPGIIPLSKDFWISFIQKGIYKPKSRYQICSSLQTLSADTMRESLCTHIHTLTCTHTYMVTSHFFSVTTSIYYKLWVHTNILNSNPTPQGSFQSSFPFSKTPFHSPRLRSLSPVILSVLTNLMWGHPPHSIRMLTLCTELLLDFSGLFWAPSPPALCPLILLGFWSPVPSCPTPCKCLPRPSCPEVDGCYCHPPT